MNLLTLMIIFLSVNLISDYGFCASDSSSQTLNQTENQSQPEADKSQKTQKPTIEKTDPTQSTQSSDPVKSSTNSQTTATFETKSSQDQKDVVYVDVDGLVCDFCARALEKVFSKQASVESIDVDLDKKIVTIFFKKAQKLQDEEIAELITNSGYSIKSIRHEIAS